MSAGGSDLPAQPPAPAAGPDPGALYDALLKADRTAALGPLAAGLAREFNELLARILGALHQAGPGRPEALSRAEQACLEARELTRRLGALAEGGDSGRTAAAPADLLETAVSLAAAGSAAEVTIEAPKDASPVWVEPEPTGQAFRNLIRNAVEAMSPPPPHPRVHLRAANVALGEGQVAGLAAGDYVEFEVRDNGIGIPPENLERIWEPFFTTRRHASGLGLPAALAVIRRQGGQIGVDSTVGVGTVFTVYLPSRHPPPAVQARRAPSERFRTGRILVMDDDPEIRSATGSMLQRLDYNFDLAADGDEALACYRRYLDIGRPHDAVLLDETITGAAGGAETLARLRAIDPDVRAIVVTSGGARPGSELDPEVCGLLAKPYRLAELAEALGAVNPAR